LVFSAVFVICLHPAFGNRDFSLFVAMLRAGITDKDKRSVGRVQFQVIEVESQAFTLLDPGV
jgi:hypothetical protein